MEHKRFNIILNLFLTTSLPSILLLFTTLNLESNYSIFIFTYIMLLCIFELWRMSELDIKTALMIIGIYGFSPLGRIFWLTNINDVMIFVYFYFTLFSIYFIQEFSGLLIRSKKRYETVLRITAVLSYILTALFIVVIEFF